MTAKRVLICAVVLGAVLCIFFNTIYLVDQRHIENTAVMFCEGNQEMLYDALTKYKNDNGTLPSELSVLVAQGYVKDLVTRCPVDLRESTEKVPYHYFPEAFGNPNAIVLSDTVGNHTGEKLFPDIPVVIVTFGDGRIRCMLKVSDAMTGRY